MIFSSSDIRLLRLTSNIHTASLRIPITVTVDFPLDLEFRCRLARELAEYLLFCRGQVSSPIPSLRNTVYRFLERAEEASSARSTMIRRHGGKASRTDVDDRYDKDDDGDGDEVMTRNNPSPNMTNTDNCSSPLVSNCTRHLSHDHKCLNKERSDSNINIGFVRQSKQQVSDETNDGDKVFTLALPIPFPSSFSSSSSAAPIVTATAITNNEAVHYSVNTSCHACNTFADLQRFEGATNANTQDGNGDKNKDSESRRELKTNKFDPQRDSRGYLRTILRSRLRISSEDRRAVKFIASLDRFSRFLDPISIHNAGFTWMSNFSLVLGPSLMRPRELYRISFEFPDSSNFPLHLNRSNGRVGNANNEFDQDNATEDSLHSREAFSEAHSNYKQQTRTSPGLATTAAAAAAIRKILRSMLALHDIHFSAAGKKGQDVRVFGAENGLEGEAGKEEEATKLEVGSGSQSRIQKARRVVGSRDYKNPTAIGWTKGLLPPTLLTLLIKGQIRDGDHQAASQNAFRVKRGLVLDSEPDACPLTSGAKTGLRYQSPLLFVDLHIRASKRSLRDYINSEGWTSKKVTAVLRHNDLVNADISSGVFHPENEQNVDDIPTNISSIIKDHSMKRNNSFNPNSTGFAEPDDKEIQWFCCSEAIRGLQRQPEDN